MTTGCDYNGWLRNRMNRRTAINSAVIAAAAAATATIASAADTEIEVFVDHWKKSKDFTLKVAQAMPAENYDYKPFADARPFGGELQHLGQAESFYLGMQRRSCPRGACKRHQQGHDHQVPPRGL